MDREVPPISFDQAKSDPQAAERARFLVAGQESLLTKHRPWRTLRHVAKGAGLDPVELWRVAKLERLATWRNIGLDMSGGRPFGYCLGPQLSEPLHRIDRATGAGGLLLDESHRTRLELKALIDEAVESSLIEGAATTRKDAVEMLRARRMPLTHGERMVANNYRAMQEIKGWLARPLSKAVLLELQTILTTGTLKSEGESGRFRRPDESVRVVDERTQEDIFVPPPAELLDARIERLCAFANMDHSGENFIHPVVKACILHFMIGYEHPFVDGNGRTARAVFYWFALRNGYRIFEYIPISEKIRKGFARYPQAYIDTELDDGDLTYFILYKLDIIEQSLDALSEHLKHEEERIVRSEDLLKLNKGLRLRQRILLEHALRHPMQRYTVKSHAAANGLSLNTSRADLQGLARLKLLVVEKDGREVIYRPAPGLADRVAKSMRK
ncbi:MAG: Fic family protein [Planctomycetota bacterium]